MARGDGIKRKTDGMCGLKTTHVDNHKLARRKYKQPY